MQLLLFTGITGIQEVISTTNLIVEIIQVAGTFSRHF